MPQELASLTNLISLDLSENVGAVGVEEDAPEKNLLPKMRVHDAGLRFLLHMPRLAAVHLSVTEEERADLAGLLGDLERVRSGSCAVLLDLSKENIMEKDSNRHSCGLEELDLTYW